MGYVDFPDDKEPPDFQDYYDKYLDRMDFMKAEYETQMEDFKRNGLETMSFDEWLEMR